MPGLDDALNLAYKMLARRALSEKAVRERLAKKKVPAATLERVIRALKEVKMLSDSALSENMAQSRVKHRLLGDFRIEADLVRCGIPKDAARRAVREAAKE